jgi:diadenosine tetraphosphate (Ap4A) HIT family hydrolase
VTDDYRHDRVGTALAGANPTVLRRLRAGFAVIGDVQHLPGYCVLISDDPAADQLTDLSHDRQLLFLEDMAILGRAVSAVCSRRDPEFRRINLEIQGNTDAFLHAHVTLRYEWEPADIVCRSAQLHHLQGLVSEEHALGPLHDELRAELTAELDHQMGLVAD